MIDPATTFEKEIWLILLFILYNNLNNINIYNVKNQIRQKFISNFISKIYILFCSLILSSFYSRENMLF